MAQLNTLLNREFESSNLSHQLRPPCQYSRDTCPSQASKKSGKEGRGDTSEDARKRLLSPMQRASDLVVAFSNFVRFSPRKILVSNPNLPWQRQRLLQRPRFRPKAIRCGPFVHSLAVLFFLLSPFVSAPSRSFLFSLFQLSISLVRPSI